MKLLFLLFLLALFFISSLFSIKHQLKYAHGISNYLFAYLIAKLIQLKRNCINIACVYTLILAHTHTHTYIEINQKVITICFVLYRKPDGLLLLLDKSFFFVGFYFVLVKSSLSISLTSIKLKFFSQTNKKVNAS